MIVKSNNNINYFGPKALFDPNFIPPSLLYRKKEEQTLYSILSDSISDDFCLNILYQGINGIGKKVIINKVINDLLIQKNESNQVNKVIIDCKEKNLEELIFSLLTELNTLQTLDLDLNSLLNSRISHLWNICKLVIKKIENPLFLIVNNMEFMEPQIFNKFLQLGRETHLTLISTMNKILKPGTLELFSKFDFKKKLNYFTYQELYNILKQRVMLTFSHEIDNELIQYITDLVCEQYVPVPGKGVEILRDLYPILKNKTNFRNFELLEICQNEFDVFQITDEFSMLSYIAEEDLLNILFLDNLSNYFTCNMKYYISLKELQELYDLACENLEYNRSISEFNKLSREMINIGILKPSKRTISKNNIYSSNKTLNSEFFFLLINPKQLKIIIDTIFSF